MAMFTVGGLIAALELGHARGNGFAMPLVYEFNLR